MAGRRQRVPEYIVPGAAGPPAACGHASVPARLAGESGRIGVRLRLDESMPLADHGGCLQ